MSISSISTTKETWWRPLRPRLIILYLLVALALLGLSVPGHVRLLGEIGKTFGGFFWAIDTNEQVVIVSALPQSASIGTSASSLTNVDHIVGVTVTNKDGQTLFTWEQKQRQEPKKSFQRETSETAFQKLHIA